MAQAVVVGVSSMLRPDALVAARGLWRVSGPPRLFHADLADLPAAALSYLGELVAEFSRGADLTVLSGADVAALHGPVPPLRIGRLLRAAGAGAVLLTCGAVSVLICDDPDGNPRADGPNDILIGLPFTPTLPNLQAALGSRGVPWDAAGWLDLANTAGSS